MIIFEVLFEFIRVLIWMFFLMAIIFFPVRKLYEFLGIDIEKYLLLPSLAILLLIYIIYNNKLQFTGFYRRRAKKLSTKVTWSIVGVSIILFSIPILIDYFM